MGRAVVGRAAWAMAALTTFGALPGLAAAADMSAATRKEIDHMLSRVVASGCEFGRGSTWHNGADARVHLERKLAYLSARGMVASAEDFITMAATRSSMTGEAYAIRCKSNPPLPSAAWMETELKALRAAVAPAAGPAASAPATATRR